MNINIILCNVNKELLQRPPPPNPPRSTVEKIDSLTIYAKTRKRTKQGVLGKNIIEDVTSFCTSFNCINLK